MTVLEVKISSRGSGRDLDLSQFTGNRDNRWGDCRFHVNSSIERADVWFVIEDLDDDDRECLVPESRVVFLSAETSWPPGFYDESPTRSAFLDQFAEIHTCHDIYRENARAAIPFLPWMINANHGPSITAPHARDLHFLRSLESVEKPRELSVICSTKTMTPEHRMRLRFVEHLKAHFGDRLDWFGNGIRPLAEKWDGVAPYRYTIVLENHAAPNVITEKIADAYLGLAFPIYWGAPNLDDFVPAESFQAINIADLSGSIARIEGALEGNLADARLPSVLRARDAFLGPLHLYERLSRLCEEIVERTSDADSRAVRLTPMGTAGSPTTSRSGGWLRSLGESVNKVGDAIVQRSLR